ncbi:non-specific lipid transfer protein GPI-anchored 10 isoform X2 [Vitis vinifera]|uniref:non-specific lipid transfer protein GPI-anchored 10 isoform X2 n=1 Tax=Vitis vinifera TaxID=29760 RepID=UPI0008FEC487|nr:non-specific lipid transfer protein GPI-anchored 10 isoform X2 [Vitis vinifera]|eukprot:XP_019082163.1 PREDICTED: protein YLS3 isoform X2 [Vitis vinifera]
MWNNTQETCSSSHLNNAFPPFRHLTIQCSSPVHPRINQTTMASQSLPPTAITSLVLLLITLIPSALSQNPTTSGSTIAQCSLRLLPLASCGSYVQGSAPTPVQSCCDNLKQVYSQQPNCLCLLLNSTVMGSFPINRTLALQLPLVCNLQVSISPCSGMTVPPSSPDSQVSLGEGTNSTVAASPVVAVAPRPSIMGFGFGRSSSMRLEVKGDLAVAVIWVACLLT